MSSLEVDTEQGKSVSTCEKTEKWPLWKLAIMAFPQMGVMVLWIFLGPNFTPYLKSLGASDSMATLNNSAGPVVGFIVGPIVGAWSDQSTSKWGRRRPVIVVGLLSTIVAGFLYSGARQIAGENAVYLAAIMQWVLDFTINMMQTPFRALVADLASEEAQVPMQIWFAVISGIGCELAFLIMKIYPVAIEHMLELMTLVILINVGCVGAALLVAREKQHVPDGKGEKKTSFMEGCGKSCQGMPKAFYILLFVQAMVWMGNTVWGTYGQEWFTHSVYPGSAEAAKGSAERDAYISGQMDFSTAGLIGSAFNLVLSLGFFGLSFTSIPAHLVYAPCVFVSSGVCFLCAFVVGHNSKLAILAFVLSNVGLSAAGSFPFAIVAKWNKMAEEAGKAPAVAMQMAILNCCITVGQQLTTFVLAMLESSQELAAALGTLFIISMICNGLGGVGAFFLQTGRGARDPVCSAD